MHYRCPIGLGVRNGSNDIVHLGLSRQWPHLTRVIQSITNTNLARSLRDPRKDLVMNRIMQQQAGCRYTTLSTGTENTE